MKLSAIINYPLSFLGFKIVRQSSLEKLQSGFGKYNVDDIERDKEFMKLYQQVKEFTLVEIERCFALYSALLYITRNNIPGDLVECGVWRGGSAMLMALVLKKTGMTDRKIYLYDTFTGMAAPGENDGHVEKEEWSKQQKADGSNDWCYASYNEVEANMKSTGYPADNIKLIKGMVEETIPARAPGPIALLRLDTDWYASTRHELEYLYPLLEKKGILIIDDYGAWQGSKKATDEYFATLDGVFLNRIDFGGRLVIK